MTDSRLPHIVHRMKHVTSAASLLAACLLLAGCAQSTPEAHDAALPKISTSAQQKAALADGKVDYDEYQAGWRRYVACNAKAGYTITQTGEVNQVISGQIPDAAVDSGVDRKCYEGEFKQIDMIWQTARIETSPAAAKFRECLSAKGETPEATYAGMVQQLQDLGIDPSTCL